VDDKDAVDVHKDIIVTAEGKHLAALVLKLRVQLRGEAQVARIAVVVVGGGDGKFERKREEATRIKNEDVVSCGIGAGFQPQVEQIGDVFDPGAVAIPVVKGNCHFRKDGHIAHGFSICSNRSPDGAHHAHSVWFLQSGEVLMGGFKIAHDDPEDVAAGLTCRDIDLRKGANKKIAASKLRAI